MAAQKPRKLPESGPLAALQRWLNELLDYVDTFRPQLSHNMLTSRKTVGTSREPVAKSSDVSGLIQWKDEYDITKAYNRGDIVIVGSNNPPGYANYLWHLLGVEIVDNAAQTGLTDNAGTYIALQYVPPGIPPYAGAGLDASPQYWACLSRGSWTSLAFNGALSSVEVRTDDVSTTLPQGGGFSLYSPGALDGADVKHSGFLGIHNDAEGVIEITADESGNPTGIRLYLGGGTNKPAIELSSLKCVSNGNKHDVALRKVREIIKDAGVCKDVYRISLCSKSWLVGDDGETELDEPS